MPNNNQVKQGMAEAGYKRTEMQCRAKLKTLKSEYKKLTENKTKTGRRRKAWKFYGYMNEALHNKQATRPAIVTDNRPWVLFIQF